MKPLPTRLSCRVKSRRRCLLNSQLVGDSLNKFPNSEQSCVVSAVWTHPSAVVAQFTISCAVELLRLVTGDDIVTSLSKKLSVSMKIQNRYGVCSVSFQIVDRIRRQSSWASCDLCSHRRRRSDATRHLSRVGVGDVY